MTFPGSPDIPDELTPAQRILEQAWFHAGEVMSVAVEQIVERERAEEAARVRQQIADRLEAEADDCDACPDHDVTTFRLCARIARGEA